MRSSYFVVRYRKNINNTFSHLLHWSECLQTSSKFYYTISLTKILDAFLCQKQDYSDNLKTAITAVHDKMNLE